LGNIRLKYFSANARRFAAKITAVIFIESIFQIQTRSFYT
jgi:hypothetical protein